MSQPHGGSSIAHGGQTLALDPLCVVVHSLPVHSTGLLSTAMRASAGQSAVVDLSYDAGRKHIIGYDYKPDAKF